MNTPPPLVRDPRADDCDHLNLLVIFHFVVAGLALFGIAFLVLHYTFMTAFMSNPDFTRDLHHGNPMQHFLPFLIGIYVVFGTMMILMSVGNVLSGLFIRGRKNRMFSLVIAGLNCFHFPFGTALGAFTFIVLLRDSVRKLYQEGTPS